MNTKQPPSTSFSYGGWQIHCRITFRNRKTLAVHVHPDLQVVVSAPTGLSLDRIRSQVRQKGAWIVKQMQAFSQAPPPVPPRQFVSGETWVYLGRQYRLKVVQAQAEKVRLHGRFLWVYVKDRNDLARKRDLLVQWYRSAARALFQRKLHEIAGRVGLPAEQAVVWRLQAMRTQWGSCSPSGLILLNPSLVHAPLGCIEYVIAHELCHRIELNHTPKFYRLLSAAVGDWNNRKQRLEQHTQVINWQLSPLK